MEFEYILPKDIERRSFEIIEAELGSRKLSDGIKPIVMRAIHTTADLDYYENMYFSENAVETALSAIKDGALFVTDTNMAKAGINKAALSRHGCSVECFMADSDVAASAAEKGITRAAVSVDKAAALGKDIIYAVGNAPTALIRLKEHIDRGSFVPRLIIGMPVGFVNVVQSKEMIIESGVPCIVARGRKGGSNVAAAVCNALLYMADEK
ncbi:precorrin-8X methylmutase [uncultured Ruminococcus sp.]|uniref:precorrin-8X methylmutase n=1 Tax=uncultured Ruminococcus sp. TaxID=165186 RepID=UPI0025E990CC|nr:precorrin-8X methylmutase [uncultured Ruminococcus sp.]